MSRLHPSVAGGGSAPPAAIPARDGGADALSAARRIAVRAVVFAFALAVCLVATELALRALSKHALLVFDVEMWRYARRVKAPSELPGLIEAHRPDARALLMGVAVRTDGYGFRRPSPAIEAARRPDDRRVAALGDSVTFGWGVPEGATWPARLEALLRERCPEAPATVWNAGVGNSTTAMQLARYEHLVAPRRPDWLVLGYFVNDAEPDPEPAEHPLLWRSSLAALLSARLAQSRDGALRDYREFYGSLYEDGQPGWRATREALAGLGRRLEADGVAATLLLLPEMHHPRGHGPFAGAYAEVAAIGRAAGFEVIDTAPLFPPGPGDRFFVTPTDAHPDAAAHALFAQAAAGSRHACPGGATAVSQAKTSR
ncbi:MAG TPA: GDSL-type esterase/lipase family protein [Thermoanaerobaculia bacterium]|nr:GDSL-type esterase/lipase family protein [Thermoanaerobaculia bacterium]